MKPQRKAVTLVELLIVVLLIGVMTFIAVPRMGFSTITGGKTQTTARRVAAAIRHTRSLAIANAATNNQGFSLNITGSSNPCYTIVDVNTGRVVETSSIAPDVNCTVADNEKILQISLDVQKSVQMGNSVAESLEKHKIFPPIIIQLADSGEQAGMLGQMLNKGVDFLEKDIERTTNSLLVKLEPALTLGMGAVIGLILLAVYLPMFDYMSHLK